jgi:RHS repeat-associated protein
MQTSRAARDAARRGRLYVDAGNGLPAGRSLPGGISTDQSYVSTHAPSRLWFSSIPVTIALGTEYGYGAKGFVSGRKTYLQEPDGVSKIVREYAYDRQGQLTYWQDEKYPEGVDSCSGTTVIDPDGGACLPGGQGQLLGAELYTYDKVGNRTDRGGNTETGNRQTAFDGYQFTYDADGKLLRKWKTGYDRTLGWNSLGQMISATPAGQGTTTYGCDAFGRRVRRTAPDGSVTRYLYDGDDLLMELNGAGNPIREYTYLPGVDRPHSVRVSATGASYYYATDHPANVVGLLNATGQVVNEYEYDPWGRVTVIAEGVPQPLGYAAREWDATAGLYQVRARWYDPHTGRFVSEDPIGLAGGINVYAYALNSPVNYTDPSGLQVLETVTVTVSGCSVPGWVRGSEGHCELSVGSDIDPDYGTGGYSVPHHRQFGGTVLAGQRWPLTWREQERVQCLVDNWSSPEGQAWYPKLNFVTGGTVPGAQAEFIYPNTVAFAGRGSRGDPLRNHSEMTMVHIILHEFGHGAQYAAMGKQEFDRVWRSPGGEDALQADADRYADLHKRISRTRCPF